MIPSDSNALSASQASNELNHASQDSVVACRCGCVPNLPSLFEMAKLRAEYRKKQLLNVEKLNNHDSSS